jgi:hypothetical protein
VLLGRGQVGAVDSASAARCPEPSKELIEKHAKQNTIILASMNMAMINFFNNWWVLRTDRQTDFKNMANWWVLQCWTDRKTDRHTDFMKWWVLRG